MCNKRHHSMSGFTLFELLLLIVVFAIGLAGILAVFNTTVIGSADPMMRKQAMAVAESMMEEILLQPFAINGAAPSLKNQTTRKDFDDVRDYAGFQTTGIYRIDDSVTPIAGLGNFSVAAQVANTTLSGVSAALLVTVTVTGPKITYVLDGYKLDW